MPDAQAGNGVTTAKSPDGKTLLVLTSGIAMTGQPNRMILNKAQTRLYVAVDNSDTVAAIDPEKMAAIETFETIAPFSTYSGALRLHGSNPHSLALSPDEKTLYVTNGGSNSIAVVRLGESSSPSEVVGLIPTAWYPNSVTVMVRGFGSSSFSLPLVLERLFLPPFPICYTSGLWQR